MQIRTTSFALLAFLLAILTQLTLFGTTTKSATFRGRVVCLDPEGNKMQCSNQSETFGLETLGGERILFSKEDSKSKMFRDPRVRARELEVKVWRRSDGHFDIIKVWSVKNGELFDLYYFCAVCNIKTFVGGACWCCQEDFEFKETAIH